MCVEAIIYLSLYNLQDSAFKRYSNFSAKMKDEGFDKQLNCFKRSFGIDIFKC